MKQDDVFRLTRFDKKIHFETHKFSIRILYFGSSEAEFLPVLCLNDALSEAAVETHNFTVHCSLSGL